MTDPDVYSLLTQFKWPASVPEQVRPELTQLLAECGGICHGKLESFQSFKPFGLACRRNGGMSIIGGDFMPEGVDDPITYLLETLYRSSANYTALSVVHDVQNQDATVIRVYLEHVHGVAFRVWIPWRRLGDDNVRLEQPAIEATEPLIWSDSG
jgi:hypothetical protein